MALFSAVFFGNVFALPPSQNPLGDKPFANKAADGYNLEFNDKQYTVETGEVDGKTVKYRAFEKIVYVKNPVEPDYQTINFYVPEDYFADKEINGFNAQTAPIFLPNSIGGYMPAMAATAAQKGIGGRTSTILTALSKGYVVASVGARGRTLGKTGAYTGKAPAVIVDLKAAVRYLHANNAKMPGDANKIISNGTSAGGAMSALLAASGDSNDYAEYLDELGAANASDAIFAASVYCPITDLEHADMAYEWEFNGLNQYERMDMSELNAESFNNRSKPMKKTEGTLSPAQVAVSNELKAQFPAYLNSLNLKDEKGNALSLEQDGSGSFKDFIKFYLIESANKAITQGADLSQIGWLKFNRNKITDLDFTGFVHSKKRMKLPPAFDAFDLSSAENNEFGDSNINNKHFTVYSLKRSTVNGKLADSETIKLLNAMNYTNNRKAARHWRIRAGSADYDTSHAISAILTVKLRMSGKNVDYAIPWAIPHSGDYDLDELFQWMDGISKK